MIRERCARFARRLRRERRGATIIEFALVAPVMLLLIMGLCDLLYQMYAQEILNGAIQKAARDSTIQGASSKKETIDAAVITAISSLMQTPTASCATTPAAQTYCSTRTTYTTFSAAGPEPFNDDNGNNQRDAGECYQDLNGNGSWDSSAGTGTSGQGGANDVTLYRISITYAHLFPVPQVFGKTTTDTISAQTLLKNQPYASSNDPTVTWLCT